MNHSVKFRTRPSKKYDDGRYMLFLKVTVSRQEKYYSLGKNYACYENQWDGAKQRFKKNFEGYEDANSHLKSLMIKANRALIELEMQDDDYTIHDFDVLYKSEQDMLNILAYFKEVSDEMKQSNYGYARVFIETSNSVKLFLNEKKGITTDYPMINIGKAFLQDYEKFLRRENSETKKPTCSDNTISIRFRTLRRLFNIAKEEKAFKHYPFNEFSLKHLSKKTKKRALKPEELKKIFDLKIEEKRRAFKTLLYFKFMFYTRGMNYTDMARLRYRDIKGGKITYIRAKNKKETIVPLVDNAKEIMEYFKPLVVDEDYVFPILYKQHKTQKQVKDRIKTCLGRLNDDLKDLAEEAKLDDVPLSSYYSRHSFATILKYLGVPIAQISELLNHEDIKTTEIYLDEFETEELDRVANNMFDTIDKLELKEEKNEESPKMKIV